MSLINQVLQNVEARQGSAALGMPAGHVWNAEQVKPVLSQTTARGAWFSRTIWVCLLLAGVAGLVINAPVLIQRWSSLHVQSAAERHTVAPVKPVAVRVDQPVVVAIPQAPQLTKTLFSRWQDVAPSRPTSPRPAAAPTAAAAQATTLPKANVTPAVMPATVPQIEGEFSIKAASPAIVSESAVEITPLKREETDAAKGLVNKQMRPDQEANVQIQRAIDHEQKGRLNEALLLLRQVLSTSPQSEDARQLLAAYLFESRQEQEAVSVLQAGIKQFPAQVNLAKSLAKWQLAHAQPEAVLQTLKPVANQFAQDAESQWMLAMAYQQTGQHAAALPHFERANALRPGAAQWMVAYAISLQAAGQHAQALLQLQQAQALPLSERLLEFVTQRIRQLGGTQQARAD